MLVLRTVRADNDDIDEYMEIISPIRLERIRAAKNTEFISEQIAASRALDAVLREILPDYVSPPDLSYDVFGAPKVPYANVSIAHTRGIAVCAASDAPVGIDIETCDRAIGKGVAERYLSKMSGNPLVDWVTLEACVKLTGKGFSGVSEIAYTDSGVYDANGRRIFMQYIEVYDYLVAIAQFREEKPDIMSIK